MSVKSYVGVSGGNGTTPPLSSAPSTLTDESSGSHGYLGGRYPSHGGQAWWSVGDFLRQGVTHQSVGLTLAHPGGEEELWDLSDSLADLPFEVNAQDHSQHGGFGHSSTASGSTKTLESSATSAAGSGSSSSSSSRKVDVKSWIEQDTSHGFIRVFNPDSERHSKLFPCTLYTTAQKICLQLGLPSNALHIQLNGDIIRRLEPFDCPLAIQSECLTSLGFTSVRRVQEEGALEDLQYLIKFYSGKPVSDSTYSRNQLTAYAYVRKGKLLHQWVRRYCVISGTRLLIYRDKTSRPTVVQLAKGSVEEVQVKGQERVLKLTSTLQGERAIYIALTSESDYSRWLKKAKKATSKLPTKADLSNCHLEFLPETVFINDDLQTLVLRHNALKERPIEEDIYTIGWLDDLPRFTHLRSLNLADNNLQAFPLSVCSIHSLVELNLASNKLEEIPPQISDLSQLQALHVHNNHLTMLPEELVRMRNLRVIVLAFNRFTSIPGALLQTQNVVFQIDSVIMAGNQIERLPSDHLGRMAHIRKIDLRLNRLQLLPTETAKFGSLEHITHLDIRDNCVVVDLDLRAIRALEYLNCERNAMHSLQVNGTSLKNLFAAHNNLETLSINPKPEWIVNMDVSYNQLAELPPFLGDCFFLVRLDISHNNLVSLPAKLLSDTRKLKLFKANHNRLTRLPSDIQHSVLEELHVQHNQLKELPPDLFIKVQRLRYLNATKNQLTDLPTPNRNETYNKLQELYLTANRLTSRAVAKINCFPRLRILHLASNRITQLDDSDFESLENLVELNVSSNNLTELPWSLGRHAKLQVLRANSNLIQEIPSFKNSSCLKVLEVGSNRLVSVSMTNLMSSQVNLLDISGNPDISVNTHDLEKHAKRVCMVDMRGQTRSLQEVSSPTDSTAGLLPNLPWQSGFSQTSGIRNKLSVAILNRPRFTEGGDEALFGLVDGGRNDEVVKTLADMLPALVQEELQQPGAAGTRDSGHLKYSLLTAHRKLKALGQRVGASAALVHLSPAADSPGNFVLHVANVGDAEVVLCRQGKPLCLTRAFAVSKDSEECHRIIKSDGIITEDGRVNGVTYNTRLLGCSFLFPQVIPSPHVASVQLGGEDQLLVVGSQGLWKFLSHQEALDEVMDIPDPVIAAKRLQDLAQAYGSKENVGVLVVRLLLSEGERERMSGLLAKHREGQRSLLAMLAAKTEILQMQDGVGGAELEGIVMDKAGRVKKPRPPTDRPSLSVRPLPTQRYRKKDAPENWEAILQRRLQEEVKQRELQRELPAEGASARQGGDGGSDSNWSTLTRPDSSNTDAKSRSRTTPQDSSTNPPLPRRPNLPLPPPPPLPLPPPPPLSPSSHSRHTSDASLPLPSPPPPLPPFHFRSGSTDTIASFEEFSKQPVIQNNVDRDAILFHQMQMAARAHSASTTSMDSTKSDPLYASVREVYGGPKASSHSIEVLVHVPPNVERRGVPPPPPPPPPPPSSHPASHPQGAQGGGGGGPQRSSSESGDYGQRSKEENEMYAMETEVLEDFQVSIDEMYATVMKKKKKKEKPEGDSVKEESDLDDEEEEEEEAKDRKSGAGVREGGEDDDDDHDDEGDYMSVGEAHGGVPTSSLYRCLADSQSLTSINDAAPAEGDNSSLTGSPSNSPVASPAGSPGQQRVSRTPSEASVIITYL